MTFKIAYLDFWMDCENTPCSFNDINNIDVWNNLTLNRQLKNVDEGVGLFHKDNISKILNKPVQVTSPDKADVIICSGFGNQRFRFPEKKKIFLSFESNFLVPDDNLPNTMYFSSSLSKFENIYYLPIYVCYFGFNIYKQLKEHRSPLTLEEFEEKIPCLSIISNENGDFRNQFLDKLMMYIKVHNYGKYKHNKDNKVIQESSWFDPRLGNTIKNYKFMVCMENKLKPFYHTEKIMHAFRNRIVPIYWGDPVCKLIFNSNAYINVNELGIDKAVEKILMLSNNIEEYNKMLTANIFNDDSILFRDDFVKYTSEEYFNNRLKDYLE